MVQENGMREPAGTLFSTDFETTSWKVMLANSGVDTERTRPISGSRGSVPATPPGRGRLRPPAFDAPELDASELDAPGSNAPGSNAPGSNAPGSDAAGPDRRSDFFSCWPSQRMFLIRTHLRILCKARRAVVVVGQVSLGPLASHCRAGDPPIRSRSPLDALKQRSLP